MAPTVEGEFKRKRRMMWGLWDVMLRWGMLNPRGYSPAYALEIYSHRLLRYLTPWLHLVALAANVALLGEGTLYVVDDGGPGRVSRLRRCWAASSRCCRCGSPTTTSP